ncbi:MAG: peptidylprolyl isomerase [Verrucomicrobia bacterium]|nr:MAG: peptidylprolyl isomerase [Verrucomicrobiota bacterium]
MIRSLSKYAAFVVALTTLAVSFASAQATGDVEVGARFANGIAAIVENRIITVGDIRREIQPLLPQIRMQSRTEAEFRKNIESVEDEIIQNLVDQVLIVKDFYSDEKRRIPPNIIDEEIEERIITQFEGDRSKFLEYLRAIGKTQREYRQLVTEEIIVGYMRGQMRKSEAVVSPVKIENFYVEHRDRFYQPDRAHIRLIKLSRIADEDEAILEQTAETILKRLEAGESFADLAREFSQDSRKEEGGDWGWLNREDLREELADAAFALEPGQHTEPIRLGDDIYILYLEDKRDAGIQPLEEVRDQIERILVSQMARQAQERWLERLRRNAYVRYFN